MTRKSKRFREIEKLIDVESIYTLADAIAILKKCPPVKFDQSVELSLKTGVDTRKADQQVRGTVSLPNGTGKKMTVLVFAKGEKVKEALDAGADFAGNEELLAQVLAGWTGFNAVIATPDMMRDVGKLGKVLGPRGLMPTPKAGTVTSDVVKAVQDVKGGKIEFKVDKSGVINALFGKLSFSDAHLLENVHALIAAILRAKPATTKGIFFKSLAISSTMGPGLQIDVNTLSNVQGTKEL